MRLPRGSAPAISPPCTMRSDPIMPPIMCPSTWQCRCHSPTGPGMVDPPGSGSGGAPMKLVLSWIVKKNELAGPKTRVSSNWETALV